MAASIRIPVEEASQCAEARRAAGQLASELGFDEVRAERRLLVPLVEVAIFHHVLGDEATLARSLGAYVSGLNMTATRAMPGAISFNSSSDFSTTE